MRRGMSCSQRASFMPSDHAKLTYLRRKCRAGVKALTEPELQAASDGRFCYAARGGKDPPSSWRDIHFNLDP
jgi:hypothetical protein